MSPATPMAQAPGTRIPTPALAPTGLADRPARLVLAGLGGLAWVAALQALVLPRWPQAAPLAEAAVLASLRNTGLEVTVLPSRPGQRSSELALGSRLAFQLRDGTTTATLQLLPAQVRQRANFQLALISRHQPSLALPPGSRLRGDGRSLAYVEGRLGQQQLRQTCLVSQPQGVGLSAEVSPRPLPVGGVTAAQLGAAADRGASGALVTISRILGFSPNRNFGCLLVSLGQAGPATTGPATTGLEPSGSPAPRSVATSPAATSSAAPLGMEQLWAKVLAALSGS